MRNRGRLVERYFAYAPLLFAAVGCSTFAGLERASPALEAGAPSNHECRLAHAPAAAFYPGLGEEIDFAVATRSVDFGEAVDGGRTPPYFELGYDLDGECTGSASGSSCVEPPWATADHTDGPGGRDNAFGTLVFRTHENGFGSLSQAVSSQAGTGFSNVLRVRQYNGKSLDNQVDVSWYAGRWRKPSATPGSEPDSSPPAGPKWEGDDDWVVFDDWLEPTSAGDGGLALHDYQPRYHDPIAYVTTDHLLVAHFREAPTAAGVFLNVTVSGRLELVKSAWALRDASFAAVQRADDLLTALPQITRTGQQLCVGNRDYEELKRTLCSYVDISSLVLDEDRAADGAPPPACDALSMGWRFDAEPINVVGVDDWDVFWEGFPHECPDASSPAHDSCGTLR